MSNLRIGERVVHNLKRRFRRLPRWPYVVAAIVLAVIGHIINETGGLPALKAASLGLVDDLGVMQPTIVIPAYFDRLFDCGVDFDAIAGCSAWRMANPLRYFQALLDVTGDIWATVDGLARGIFVVAILFGFITALMAVLWIQSSNENRRPSPYLITLVIAAILAPLFAAFIAFLLKWLAIAMLYVFGSAIGLLIWLATILAIPVKVYGFIKNIEDTSRNIRKAVHVAAPPANSKIEP